MILARRGASAMLMNQEFGAHSAPLESEEIYICLSSVGTFIESNNTWNSWFLCEFALLEWILFLYFAGLTYPATYGRGSSFYGARDISL